MKKKPLFTQNDPPENEHLWGLYDCSNLKALRDRKLDQLMARMLKECGIDTFGNLSYKFPPPGSGVTAVVIVGASRADAHCWPELGTCILGCFACGDKDQQMYEFLHRMMGYLRPRLTYEIPERRIPTSLPNPVPFTWNRIEAPPQILPR